MVELSVVVLCYHSEKAVRPLFNNLKVMLDSLSIEYEIILVANDFEDSKDKTRELVRTIADENQEVIAMTLKKEGMMGWDMIQGINASNGKFICVIDGDGQFPIASIKEVYSTIKSKKCDIVKTFRHQRHDGFNRKILSVSYNTVFRILYPGLHSKDINSKPKIFTKKTIARLELESTGWFIDAEIMIKARKLKLEIEEIPIVFLVNENRKSFVKMDAIVEFLIHLIWYKFKKN